MSDINTRIAASQFRWEHQQARPDQLPPDGDWMIWLIQSGRGWGKTRVGAETIAKWAIRQPNTRWAILAPTFGDARDTCVEGESGLLNILRRYGMLREKNGWNRSIGEIHLTNGSRIKCFSGDEPDRLRGSQHHGAWVDEYAAFRYPDAFDQLQFGLRLGQHPRTVITTTPRSKPFIRALLKRQDGSVIITRGATFDNKDNLAPAALAELLARYEGTRLGKQELYGELLEDVEGALWTLALIESARITEAPHLSRVIVAVDPAVTETGDETGIIVAGRDTNHNGYVLADYSMRGRPDAWARQVIEAYDIHMADSVVVEVNQGGELVSQVLRTIRPSLPIREVRASKGKRLRAEPISALYEQGKVHHVGVYENLENQMCEWTPDDPKSPDRLDALVWAMTDLIQHSGVQSFLDQLATMCPACNYPNKKEAIMCISCMRPISE
jgi:phage terminase large subunit-like protein